jgi:hypothetical protein
MLVLALGPGIGMAYMPSANEVRVLDAEKDFSPVDCDLLMEMVGCPHHKGECLHLHEHLGAEYFTWRERNPIDTHAQSLEFTARVRLLTSCVAARYPFASVVFSGCNVKWVDMAYLRNSDPKTVWRGVDDIMAGVYGEDRELVPLLGGFVGRRCHSGAVRRMP